MFAVVYYWKYNDQNPSLGSHISIYLTPQGEYISFCKLQGLMMSIEDDKQLRGEPSESLTLGAPISCFDIFTWWKQAVFYPMNNNLLDAGEETWLVNNHRSSAFTYFITERRDCAKVVLEALRRGYSGHEGEMRVINKELEKIGTIGGFYLLRRELNPKFVYKLCKKLNGRKSI